MGAFSLFLIAIGAILAFAVNFVVEDFDLEAIGVILMAVGFIGLIIAALRGEFGWHRGTGANTRVERHVSPDGNHVVEEHHTV